MIVWMSLIFVMVVEIWSIAAMTSSPSLTSGSSSSRARLSMSTSSTVPKLYASSLSISPMRSSGTSRRATVSLTLKWRATDMGRMTSPAPVATTFMSTSAVLSSA